MEKKTIIIAGKPFSYNDETEDITYDTLTPISEEDATRIFGRFYRGSSVQQEEGVGIGLYLTREIIAKEDGYIKAVPNDKRKGGELVLYLKRC